MPLETGLIPLRSLSGMRGGIYTERPYKEVAATLAIVELFSGLSLVAMKPCFTNFLAMQTDSDRRVACFSIRLETYTAPPFREGILGAAKQQGVELFFGSD